jgi:predicted nucleic acid-binding protein
MAKIYLDTFVFMDILSGNEEFSSKAKKYLEEVKAGKSFGIVSCVLFEELAFHIKRRKGTQKAEEILFYIQSLPGIEFVPVSQDIAKLAGILRARYAGKIEKKLTYLDCIHLATALHEKCDQFITGDRGFRDILEIKIELY